ncbi:hypothetical protein As57867_024834, partial [Aphanomyces stellatus]
MNMEDVLPFTGPLARVALTRSMETVVSVPLPLPPQGQAEVDELRMQNVERAAASLTQFNQMTYEQLAQFHAQHEALARRMVDEATRQSQLAAMMERNRVNQDEAQALLLRQQQELHKRQEELNKAIAEQARKSQDHESLLQQASEKVRRDSERWGLFAEATNQKAAPVTAPEPIGRSENLMGVQQVPLAPMYKGSTKRERREFMDEYLAYSRRVEVLNRGVGGKLFLMPLAACIDQKIVPRLCAHDFAKSFEEISEDEWRDYFLSAREVQELDMDAVARAMASLKMDTRIRDAESRVGRLLSDFYDKLEQLDVGHLPQEEPKQSVKILVAAIRPAPLKATVERQLAREANKTYKSDVTAFCQWLIKLLDNFMLFESQMVSSDKKPEHGPQRLAGGNAGIDRKGFPPKRHDGATPARAPATPAKDPPPPSRGCLKCGSAEHKVLQCPKCRPGEAKRLLDERFKKPHVGAVAAPKVKPEEKRKPVAVAVGMWDGEIVSTPTGSVTPVRTLEWPLELGGFMEDMKLSVDREVKLKLTFDTPEGTLVLANLKCWVATAPLQGGLGDLIVSRAVMARLGYCPRSLLSNAR